MAASPASRDHKSNLIQNIPAEVKRLGQPAHYVHQPALEAGDCLIFTEALVHGTRKWTAEHERRALLYKFSPGFQAYSAGVHQISYPDFVEDMSEEERAVMEAPHIRR